MRISKPRAGLRPIVLLVPFRNGNVARLELPGDTPPETVEVLRREYARAAAHYESPEFQDSLPPEARSGAADRRTNRAPSGAKPTGTKPTGTKRPIARGVSRPSYLQTRATPSAPDRHAPGRPAPTALDRSPGAPIDARTIASAPRRAASASPVLEGRGDPTTLVPRVRGRKGGRPMPAIARTTPRTPVVTDADLAIDPIEAEGSGGWWKPSAPARPGGWPSPPPGGAGPVAFPQETARQRVRAILATARETADGDMTPERARRLEAALGPRAFAAYRTARGVAVESSSPDFDAARAAVTENGTMRSPDQDRGALGIHNAGRRVRRALGGMTKWTGQVADAALGHAYSDAIVQGVPKAERKAALDRYYDKMGQAAFLLPSIAAGVGIATPLTETLLGGGMGAVTMAGGAVEPGVTLLTSQDPEELADARRRLVEPLLTQVGLGAAAGALHGAASNLGRGGRAVASGAAKGTLRGAWEAFAPRTEPTAVRVRKGQARAGDPLTRAGAGGSLPFRTRNAARTATPSVVTSARAKEALLKVGLFSDEGAERAAERLVARRKERGGRTLGGLPFLGGAEQLPDLAEYTILAGNYIRRKGETYGPWATAMLAKWGEDARPHLRHAWRQGVLLARHEASRFDDEYRRAIAADPSPQPYAAFKRGDNPSLFQPEDAAQARFKGEDGEWYYLFDAVEGDRAKADGYVGTRTGAVAAAEGGLGFPLGADEYGRVVWVNHAGAVGTKLQNRHASALATFGVRPITLVSLNSEANVLGSHGSGVLQSELKKAVERKELTTGDALTLFNDALFETVGRRIHPARSLGEIKELLVDAEISHPKQIELTQRILTAKRRYGLPTWNEVYHDLNDKALVGLPNSTIAGALAIDPHAIGTARSLGVTPHPYYAEAMGGTALGATNLIDPVTFRNVNPDYTSPKIERRERVGNPLSLLALINAQNRSWIRNTGEKGLLPIRESVLDLLFGNPLQHRIATRPPFYGPRPRE